MRILWGRANSSNVMKVVWLLEELGLPYERRDVGGAYGGTDTPQYCAMNPNSRVPTLEEDGFTLYESNVILRYLCDSHSAETPLWPRAARRRADIDRWMDWQQTTLTAPMTTVFWGLVRTPPEKRDAGAIEAGVRQAGESWAILDAVLAKRPYVAGDALTLADLPLGVHAHRWESFAVHRPELPHLKAWYERLLKRPAYRGHVALPMT